MNSQSEVFMPWVLLLINKLCYHVTEKVKEIEESCLLTAFHTEDVSGRKIFVQYD
jgi:hypothetical protein